MVNLYSSKNMSQCDVCYKTFQSACNLVTHYRMHTDERPFTCNICQKGFRQKGHLTDHLKLHGDEKSYKCKICGKAYKQSSGLRNHRSRFHGTYAPKKTKGRPPKPKPDTIRSAAVKAARASRERTVDVDVENLHRCDICDETFLTGTKLDNHLAWHARRKRYKCMVCRRIFKHLSIFKKHQKLHERSQKKSSNNRTQHTNMSDVHMQDPGRIKATGGRIGGPFCETCQKSFSCRFSFTRHIKEYHEGLKRARAFTRSYNIKTKKFRCQICQKMFSTIYSLKVHRKRIHPSKTHKCHICSKTYGLANDLKNHYKHHNNLHLPYKCDICGKPFQYQSQLKEHYMVHARQKQGHLQLNEQLLSSGSSEGPHECDVCGKHFRYPSRLREHLIIHQNEPSMPNSDWPYQCTVCQKVFRYPSRLQGHYKTHANEKQEDSESQQARHLCTICGKAFQFASHLRRHQTTHYKQQEEPVSSKTLSKVPYECDTCGRMFQYPSQLREHSVVHSEQGEMSNSRQSKRPYRKNQNQGAYHQPKQNTTAITPHSECYECDVCGNTFQHKAFLARHYVVHERDSGKKPYSCAYCERSFWQTNHLKRHCQGQHNTDNIFKCEVCFVTFKKKVELRDHLLTCCGTQAKKDSSQNEIPAKGGFQRAKRHVGRPPKKRKKRFGTNTHGTQTVNTGGLKYTENGADNSDKKQYTLTTKKIVPTCNICGAKFSSASGLRMHLDIHFDRRPYSCRFCEMKFRQLGHLSSHCKTIHHEEFPYQCELCDMPFKGTVTFKTHQQIAHGLTENPNELDGFEKSALPRYSNIDFEPKKYTRIVHSGQTEYACGFCDASARTFKSLSGLRRHITIVHTSNVNQPISDENANYPRGMVTMPREESLVTLNSAEEIYKCNVCSVIVHGWEALEAHEKAHSKRSVNSPSSTAPVLVAFTPPTPSIKQTFECTFCGAEFDAMSREAFDEHQLQHELVAETPMGMGYICGECDQEFAMLADLVNHHEQTH